MNNNKTCRQVQLPDGRQVQYTQRDTSLSSPVYSLTAFLLSVLLSTIPYHTFFISQINRWRSKDKRDCEILDSSKNKQRNAANKWSVTKVLIRRGGLAQ